jgi:hypothetical protein
MESLPRNEQGYPIPWFVAHQDDGTRDFRIAGEEQWIDAIRFKKCWVCGKPKGRYHAFLIGPMCAVNRITSEPPSHLECATYSALCCPFMASPQMVRRDKHKPEGVIPPPGIHLDRNPGVGLVWVTTSFDITIVPEQRDDDGNIVFNKGRLVRLGDPTELHWYATGRPATYTEIVHSIERGLPILQANAEADGPEAVAHLQQQTRTAYGLIDKYGPAKPDWMVRS